MAAPIEWPPTITFAKRGRIAWTTWWAATAWADALSNVLSGFELPPVPRRSRASVATPAWFIASRNERISGV
jgi:hypothetical protein